MSEDNCPRSFYLLNHLFGDFLVFTVVEISDSAFENEIVLADLNFLPGLVTACITNIFEEQTSVKGTVTDNLKALGKLGNSKACAIYKSLLSDLGNTLGNGNDRVLNVACILTK